MFNASLRFAFLFPMCLCWFCSVVLLACASLISFESFSVDTVKTRLQGQPLPARYHGTFHAATTIIRQEGFFRGLYSGIILILCMFCLRLSILFIDFILFYFILFYFFWNCSRLSLSYWFTCTCIRLYEPNLFHLSLSHCWLQLLSLNFNTLKHIQFKKKKYFFQAKQT